MANILDPTENLSPVSGLKGIYTKLIEVIRRLNVLLANSGSSKVYKALITQSGTDAPVATVLVNTLGITTTWVYDNIGEYSVNVDSGIIDNAKVFIDKELKIISPSYIDDQAAQIGVFDGAVTRVSLKSTVFTTGVAANDIINSFTLTIEVFP